MDECSLPGSRIYERRAKRDIQKRACARGVSVYMSKLRARRNTCYAEPDTHLGRVLPRASARVWEDAEPDIPLFSITKWM